MKFQHAKIFRIAPARALSLALLSALALASQAQAQDAHATFEFAKAPGRLPKNVVPREYTVSITPDAAKLTIAGTESIVLDFTSADATIQFNSLNQKLSNVRFDGKPVRSVTSDDTAQLTTVTLAAPAAPGRHTLSFAYTGKIEQEPHGLFLQKYVTPSGESGALLSTQLETTDARRMFPCWDEPAFRAVFKLSVTVPAKWAVYSNMPAAGRRVKGALATTSFAPTPPMSSYLVEFSGGKLAHIAAGQDGVQFRVVAVKGQEQGGRRALADTQRIVADYTDYFGVRYSLPKLDSIAIPGGFQGGMENWGAITYVDRLLLQTPSTTMGDRQTAYSIQAHELAHQWFGNLVTMGWWDELWLNESFASWMGSRQTDRRHPDWHWWERQDGAKEAAMDADATANSHPLLQRVTNELEANAALDPAITYLKGQSVLRMLEAHMGEDVFRDGMRRYIAAHAYGNTFSGDLWRALDTASGAKVGDMAALWTSQPGFPLVSVAASCDAGGARTIALSQTRFLMQGLGGGQGRWQVPLQVRSGLGAARPLLFDGAGQTVAAGRCDEPLSVNAGAIGYFRAAYDDATLALNTRHFGALPAADRIALLDDQWALARAGARPLGGYLALAGAMGDSANLRAWEQITGALETIERAERGQPGHARFIAHARAIITPLAERMGWSAGPDETPGEQSLRRMLLGDLGRWGDPKVIAEARRRFAAFVADRKALGDDDQSMVLAIVARHATAAEFDQLHAIARGHKDETELMRYSRALMQVGDPALAARAAAIAMSDEIPAQAERGRVELIGNLGVVHPQLAWTVFSGNADKLMAPYQPMGARIMAASCPGMFGRTVPLDELEAWLKARVPVELAPQLARAMETARFELKETAALARQADAYLDEVAARAR